MCRNAAGRFKGLNGCIAFAALALLTIIGRPALPIAAQTFLSDDPVWVDPDRLDMPPPEPWYPSDTYDFLVNTFGDPGEDRPAVNINTLQEVPNSSWYTNRHYLHPMTLDELRRGPNTTGGPAEGEWRVVDLKQEGKSLGMQIVDARGDRYLLKFDPPGFPEISSGPEVISTKLFYALGYNVPENYIAWFDHDQLVPDEEEGVTQEQVDELLDAAYRYPDDRYRVLASLFLDGKPLGPFLYHGTRADDANDIWPHEARRELRGMRMIAAWLNHDDARSINSLDMLIEHGDSAYVRHNVIDFGSTLGGSPIGPSRAWAGHEYILEVWPIIARTFSFGFAGSKWVDIDYPDFSEEESRAIGRYTAALFDPLEWVPQYPNPAFQRMDAADAFWAGRQIAAFTDEQLRVIVETAEYTHPETEAAILRALINRRDKVARAVLGFGGGIDRFSVEDGALHFDDLAGCWDLRDSDRPRKVSWYVYDNEAEAVGTQLGAGAVTHAAVPLPAVDHPFILAKIDTADLGTTAVYLRRRAEGRYQVVGVARE